MSLIIYDNEGKDLVKLKTPAELEAEKALAPNSFYGCIAWNKKEGRYSIIECESQAEAEAFMGLHRFEDRVICSDRRIYYKLRRAVTGQPEI